MHLPTAALLCPMPDPPTVAATALLCPVPDPTSWPPPPPATLIPSCRRRALSSPRRCECVGRGVRRARSGRGQTREEEEATAVGSSPLLVVSSPLPIGASALVVWREVSEEREGEDA